MLQKWSTHVMTSSSCWVMFLWTSSPPLCSHPSQRAFDCLELVAVPYPCVQTQGRTGQLEVTSQEATYVQSWLLVFVLQPAIWQPAVHAMLQGNCCTENTCAINKRFTCDSAAASSCWVRSIENSLLLHVHTQWIARLSFCQEAAKT